MDARFLCFIFATTLTYAAVVAHHPHGPANTVDATTSVAVASADRIHLDAASEQDTDPRANAELSARIYALLPLAAATANDHYDQVLHAPRKRSDASSVRKSNGPAMKIMIVGDSMSQGGQGDWTWRYRIWKWFRSQHVPVDFVGPYSATRSVSAASPPKPPPLYGHEPADEELLDGTYAAGVSPDFDHDHFARWGQPATRAKHQIGNFVKVHEPELLLVMLGFNDLGWNYSDVGGTLSSIKQLVDEARAARPDIKIALANIPQRKLTPERQDMPNKTAEYNALLANAVPEWSTAHSPIFKVPLQETYPCAPADCPGGYDGLHPNERGEFHIARAFTLTLVKDFKIGKSPLKIPRFIRARSMPMPSNFHIHSSPFGVTAMWDRVQSAYEYEVRIRLNGEPKSQAKVISVPANRWDSEWAEDGSKYEVQIRAKAGDHRHSKWTSPKTAISRPQTAPPPVNVTLKSMADSFQVTWDPPSGLYTDSIIEYNVLYLDCDVNSTSFTSAAFSSSPATIVSLTAGHRYLVAISTWNENGAGFPDLLGTIIIGETSESVKRSNILNAQDKRIYRREYYSNQLSACNDI
ncbi:factor for adipocyte differentiation [Teratosphaeria destructans]|uniref:Factor for adipocyte differentiation n=1 Tax=Teratosphaeria destructans TaxID=418781 RepID=A0A9W7SZ73_9PEZI|nr:factor for adipocyte differentiation [Teratosphaeria destructans]